MITEPNALRQEYIENHHTQLSIVPEVLRSEDFFDLIVDGVGYENTHKFASQHVMIGGVIAHIGLGSALGGLDILRMTLQEITALIHTLTPIKPFEIRLKLFLKDDFDLWIGQKKET